MFYRRGIMVRTQIYLSEEQRALLSVLATRKGENVSELIREAVDHYISGQKEQAHSREKARREIFKKAFGMWKGNTTDFAEIRSSADRI